MLLAAGCTAASDAERPADADRPGLHGTVVEFPTLEKVSGGTITALDRSATTDASGRFSLDLPLGTPFTFAVAAPGHVRYLSQEMVLNGPFQQDATFVTLSSLVPMLEGGLDGVDRSLGVLSINVLPRGGCADETGATLRISPPGTIRLAYADEMGLPNPATPSFVRNQYAVLYNVPIGAELSITVEHPTCRAAAFPFTDPRPSPQPGAVTYTGKGFVARDTLHAGAVTYANVFLE